MYALIESTTGGTFNIAMIAENKRGVFRWRYDQDHNVSLGEPFSNLEDAVSVLRECRLEFKDPTRRIVIVEGRHVRLALDDIDYEKPEPEETIVN